MWWIAIAIWGAGQVAPPPLQPQTLACLGAHTIVGVGQDARLLRYDGAQWQRFPFEDEPLRLWRTSDGRILMEAQGEGPRLAVDLREGVAEPLRWVLPEDKPFRFEVVGVQTIAVSVNHRYRLDAGGAVVDLGGTPLSPKSMRPYDPPILLRSDSGTVICTGTSRTEAHPIAGHCVGGGALPYDYRAEFGGPLYSGAEGEGAEPFICANVVILARSGGTQARRLADGVEVGRAPLYARHGSQCLAGGRALIVGKREVGVFALPELRPLWRRSLDPKVRDVALCGEKLAVLRQASPTLTMIDVPHELAPTAGNGR